MIGWPLTILSLIGVVLNIKKRRSCFACWAVTNAGWMVYDWYHGLYPQAALFACYFLLALYGLREWRKQ